MKPSERIRLAGYLITLSCALTGAAVMLTGLREATFPTQQTAAATVGLTIIAAGWAAGWAVERLTTRDRCKAVPEAHTDPPENGGD